MYGFKVIPTPNGQKKVECKNCGIVETYERFAQSPAPPVLKCPLCGQTSSDGTSIKQVPQQEQRSNDIYAPEPLTSLSKTETTPSTSSSRSSSQSPPKDPHRGMTEDTFQAAQDKFWEHPVAQALYYVCEMMEVNDQRDLDDRIDDLDWDTAEIDFAVRNPRTNILYWFRYTHDEGLEDEDDVLGVLAEFVIFQYKDS